MTAEGTAEELDLATWPIFYEMSRRGLRVDMTRLQDLRGEVTEKAVYQLEIIRALTGITDFNPGASAQVAAWMEREGLGGKKTKSGNHLATDERSLKAHAHPVIDAVLEWRGLDKLAGTFIDPVITLANQHNNVIHPKWRLTKVRSGRVATEDPNLLAFPSRDEMGRKVRSCFVARPGFAFASIDYSQLEPRIVAALSGDHKLLDVYLNGKDLYTTIAADLGITRQAAKVVTLGVLYGMSAHRLKEQLALSGLDESLEYCQSLIDKWFATYPAVKRLVDKIVATARQGDGWVYTDGGRGRLLPGLFVTGYGWPASKIREEAERQAFNHVIQGTGMEQLRKAMIRTHSLYGSHLLLAIHDELVFEVSSELIAERLSATMASEFRGVQLKTSCSTGPDWGSLKG